MKKKEKLNQTRTAFSFHAGLFDNRQLFDPFRIFIGKPPRPIASARSSISLASSSSE
jgi:hypothetical protein